MKMMPALSAALALGLSLLVLGGLGLTFGGQDVGDSTGSDLQEKIGEKTGNGTSPSLDPQDGSGGGSFLSFAVGAVNEVRGLTGILVDFPGALKDLGLPGPAANALGRGTQLIIVVGLVQTAIRFNVR